MQTTTDKQTLQAKIVINSHGYRALIAEKAFEINEIISPFWWVESYTAPNYLTVQISDDNHIILIPAILDSINHSCKPNAFFDTTSCNLICITPINQDEELTFFYPSAEWHMDNPFDCTCGHSNCIGKVIGAKYLNTSQLANYKLTNYIISKLTA